jgi:hypothetical protein
VNGRGALNGGDVLSFPEPEKCPIWGIVGSVAFCYSSSQITDRASFHIGAGTPRDYKK